MSGYFRKVMIIDDNKIDRWLLRKNISNTDLAEEIIDAETGDEAIEILTAFSEQGKRFPDLIFLDMNMPMLSGMEFLAAFDNLLDLAENNTRIVITCSVYDLDEKSRVFSYNFVVGYFMKPLMEEALLQVKEKMRHNTAL